MLPLYILSKYNVRPLHGVLFQWLNVTKRLYSSSTSSSSSSSSDSSDSDSDSDSDTEKTKLKKIDVKGATPTISDNEDTSKSSLNNKIQTATKMTESSIDLTEYLNNMINSKKLQKTIDVAMQPKKKQDQMYDQNKSIIKQLSYEKRLRRAAESVADTFGGDKTKTTSDLLEKVFTPRVEEMKQQNTNTKSQRMTAFRQPPQFKEQESSPNNRYSKKKSIIQSLVNEYKMNTMQSKSQPIIENSISRQLLQDAKITLKSQDSYFARKSDINLWNGEPNTVFANMDTAASPNIPELKTWTALKQRELKALTTYSPANIFQELILWTEQGKLWKFPIDNEQGMEEEQNVHFSEHVFLERHLKEWCPKTGPVRHFMELVCTGLSKNPYLTVQEKIDHIMWYKEYFSSKQDLLRELGAIQEPMSDKAKEITE